MLSHYSSANIVHQIVRFFVAKPSSQGSDSCQSNCMYDFHEPNNVSVVAIQSATGTRPAVYSLPEVIKPGQGSCSHSSLQS